MKITSERYEEIVSNLRGHKGCIHCRRLQCEGEEHCRCERPFITVTEFRRQIKQGEILVMAETGIMRGVSKLDCND